MQATYTTARMGLFAQFNTSLKKMNNGENLPLWQKAGAGLAAGGLGALVGTPADLTLIRMQVGPAPCGFGEVHLHSSRFWRSPPNLDMGVRVQPER